MASRLLSASAPRPGSRRCGIPAAALCLVYQADAGPQRAGLRRMALTALLMAAAALMVLALSRAPLAANLARYAWWRTFADTPMSEGYVQSGDARIYYQLFGSGPPLVLLHGGLGSGLDWFSVLPQLSAQFRTLVIDLRGHGRSQMGTPVLTYRLMASDVHQVLQHLDVERCDFVGWSDGGNTALQFALAYPQGINRLITIGANFNPGGLTAAAAAHAVQPAPHGGSRLSRWLYGLRADSPAQWHRLAARVKAMWRDYPRLEAVDLTAIRAPTLVIVGAQDYIEISHAQQMADAIPDAELLVLPNTGHAIPIHASAVMLQNILRFLGPASRAQTPW